MFWSGTMADKSRRRVINNDVSWGRGIWWSKMTLLWGICHTFKTCKMRIWTNQARGPRVPSGCFKTFIWSVHNVTNSSYAILEICFVPSLSFKYYFSWNIGWHRYRVGHRFKSRSSLTCCSGCSLINCEDHKLKNSIAKVNTEKQRKLKIAVTNKETTERKRNKQINKIKS